MLTSIYSFDGGECKHCPQRCYVIRSYCGIFMNTERKKEATMKSYVAPALELVVLETEDVVMISGIKTEENGTLPEISWGSKT